MVATGALIALAAATAADTIYPPDTVLLLVAPWCAPCYGELARLGEIAAAAAPRAVRVMPIEDNARARAMVRGVAAERMWTVSPQRMRQARADLLEQAAGLPYAVVTDERGAICAGQGGGLDRERTRALVARCGRTR